MLGAGLQLGNCSTRVHGQGIGGGWVVVAGDGGTTLCCHPRYRRGPTAPAVPALTPSFPRATSGLGSLWGRQEARGTGGVARRRKTIPRPLSSTATRLFTHHPTFPRLPQPRSPNSTGSPSGSEGVVVVGPGQSRGDITASNRHQRQRASSRTTQPLRACLSSIIPNPVKARATARATLVYAPAVRPRVTLHHPP